MSSRSGLGLRARVFRCPTLGSGDAGAWTYIGLNDAIKRCETKHPGSTCDSDYGATVIRGARSIGVPEDYLEELRRALGAA